MLARSLRPVLASDLSKKMVILGGPRQCGLTTLAKSLVDEYAKEFTAQDALEIVDTSPRVFGCEFVDRDNPVAQGLARLSAHPTEAGRNSLERLFVSRIRWTLIFLSLRLPSKRALLEFEETLGDRIFSDVSFAGLLLTSKRELEENLSKAKETELRAYYSLVLTRMVMHNPRVLDAEATLSFCNRLEDIDSAFAQSEMNSILTDLIDTHQVDAKSLGFDPDFSPDIHVEWHSGFHFVSKTDFRLKP